MTSKTNLIPSKNGWWILSAVLLVSFGLTYGLILREWWVLGILPAIGIVFASIFYTEKTLMIFGALSPLSINFDNLGGGFGMSLPTEPVYMFLFLMLSIQLFREGNVSWNWFKHPVVITVSGYLLWLWISSAFSSLPVVSFKFSLARTWYISLFFYFGIKLFKDINKTHWYLTAYTASVMILVMYTLFQHSKEGFTRGSSYDISWPFFPDHGMYAATIAFAVFLLVYYALYVFQFNLSAIWVPIILVLLMILLFGIVVSFTRATWLSLIAAIGVGIILSFKVKFKYILSVLAVIAVIGIYKSEDILYSLEANKQGSSDELEGHVKSMSNITTDPSNLERINRWKCASRMVAQKPVFGFGPGTYVFKYGPFQKSSELTLISTNSGDLGDAHSEFFSAMSEMGFMGLILWLSIVLTTLSTGFHVVYHAKNLKVQVTAIMTMLSLVTYYFHSILNNYSQYDKLAVPLWSFTAILVALDIYHTNDAKKAI